MNPSSVLRISKVDRDLSVSDPDDPSWRKADAVTIETYWSGEKAPKGRRFSARLLWSDMALHVRFEAAQEEPLVVTDKPDVTTKTLGLWDRDVAEIFIAPDRSTPNKYFEFEVAPTGEWVDLAIEITPQGRVTDRNYVSKMGAAARIEKERVLMAIKIPFASLGRTPKAGDVWLGNLFRCVGKDPGRGYLAWQPTKTRNPNFHVPEAFGEFHFVK
ncbi:MAG TPA: carbohydrate-binding family 9-like protein [Pyrinomonadaceae bacterium]|nr:carbohydrate-binding family 9-like protein [Pyrinomonadaceae bacterium]